MEHVPYEAPDSLEDLLEVLDTQEATVLAGATDIMPKVNDRILSPSHLVYLGNAGLDGIKEESGTLVIGATTVLSDILESTLVQKYAPILADAISHTAGVSIRNIATIGGNICNASPAADTATPLLVMDAKLLALSKNGKRIIPIADFFTGPGKNSLASNEVLSEIIIDIEPHYGAFLKTGQRKAETLSVVNTAVKVVLEKEICSRVRIAMGSVAPRPVRCYKAEEMLVGRKITAEACRQAAAQAGGYAKPIDDGRATAWYRKRVAPVLVERALKKALGIEEPDDREIPD